MGVHLGALVVGLVGTDDLGPEHAGGTELGNLHEVVGGDAHVELDAASHLVGAAAGLGEHGHPLGAPGQGIAQLLGDESAGVAEHHAVNGQAAQVLHRLDDVEQLAGHCGDVAIEVQAVTQQALERVEAKGAAEVVGGILALDVSHQELGNLDGAAGAAVDVDLDFLDVNVGEQGVDVGGVDFALELEAHGVAAAVDGMAGLGVHFRHTAAEALADAPVVVVAGAAHEGELTRVRVRGGKVLDVLKAVEGLHVEALVGAPHEFLIEIRTF